MFLAHALDVSELYVSLREAERRQELELVDFRAEPASWLKTMTLGTLKPDAYALLARGDFEDAWWIEVDRGTESINTLRRKLGLYLLVAQGGEGGPHGMLPRVLITVPTVRRLAAVQNLIQGLSVTDGTYMQASAFSEAGEFLARTLRE